MEVRGVERIWRVLDMVLVDHQIVVGLMAKNAAKGLRAPLDIAVSRAVHERASTFQTARSSARRHGCAASPCSVWIVA